MKKIICIVGVLLTIVICYSFASFGSADYNGRIVKQEYATWCVYAVMQMHGGGLQHSYASLYVNNFLNPPNVVDCMYIDYNSQNRKYCVDHAGVKLKDLVRFVNMAHSGLEPVTGVGKIVDCFGPNHYKPLPCLALEVGTNYHALYLLYLVIFDDKMPDESSLMVCIDPASGEKLSLMGNSDKLILQ
ncbi:hypothetical protein [Butyricimonas paravirosa]